MKTVRFRGGFPAAALILLFSCSNNPPEILQNYWQLTLVQLSENDEDEKNFREELSVFTLSRDEDGDDEVESIFLIQDEEELFWELNDENWEEIEIQGEKWRGGSSFLMPGDEYFPRTEYRLLVIDKSGQRTEKSIAVSVKRITEPPIFPRLNRDGAEWNLESPYEQHTIRVYNSEGMLHGEVRIDEKNMDSRFIREQLKPSSGDSLVLIASDFEKGWLLQALPVIYN